MDQPQAPPIDYSRRYTVEEYFALEEQTGIRHEYYHGEIFPLEGPQAAPEMMAGATRRHNDLVYNCRRALTERLRGSECRAYSENVRTMIDLKQHYLFPDVVVTCSPDDQDPRTVTTPTVIVEILSDSTEARDRGWKLEHYLLIPTLTQYVLISQWRMLVESYARSAGAGWVRISYSDAEAVVPFPALGIEVPIQELYEGVPISPLRLWRHPEQSGG